MFSYISELGVKSSTILHNWRAGLTNLAPMAFSYFVRKITSPSVLIALWDNTELKTQIWISMTGGKVLQQSHVLENKK